MTISSTVSRISTSCAAPVLGWVSSLRRSAQSIGLVVVIDVAEQQARLGSGGRSGGCRGSPAPTRSSCPCALSSLWKLHARAGRVHLQIEGRRLDGLLLLAGQLGEAVGEGVGDAEVHHVDPEHLHHLVAQVVDHLHRDAAGLGLVEGAGGVAVQGRPGLVVDLGLERGLERLVGVVGAEEVGVADEEALLVVVGVDEPAGDAVGAVAADLAGAGVEDVHAVDLDLDLAVLGVEDVDVRLAEDDEQVALAGVLQVVGHVQVGVHAGLEHGDAAELARTRWSGRRS